MLDTLYALLGRLGYPHPIHPAEVHIPIGLIVGAVLFRLAAPLLHRPGLARSAHYCTVLAGIFLLPTILFGIADWQHFYDGAWLFPIKAKLALAVILLLLVTAGIFLVHAKGEGARPITLIYVCSFLVVVVLGYFGGDLVYGEQRPTASERYLARKNVFDENCAGCHPNGGNIIDPGLPLLTSTRTRDFDTFLAFVRNPNMPDGATGMMPAFPAGKISERQARELYNYVSRVLQKR